METRSTKDAVSTEPPTMTLPGELRAGSTSESAEDSFLTKVPTDESASDGPTQVAVRPTEQGAGGAATVATEGLGVSDRAAHDPTLAPKSASDLTAGVAVPLSEAPPGTLTDVSRLPRRAGAEEIVRDYRTLAMGAGLMPVPGLDLAAIGGLQLRLLASLAAQYEVAFTRAQAQSIVTSLLGTVGTTVLVGGVLMSLAKAIPGLGTLLGAASLPLAGGAITQAIGHLAIDHFEAGGTMENFDLDVAQQAFVQRVAAAQAARA